MRKRQLPVFATLVCLLLVPLVASADSHEMAPKPLTWISYVQSQTGKSMALSQYIAKNGGEIYDGLMADGHILAWGVALPVNHRAGDGWNVMEWVTFRDWAALDAFMGAFMARQMSKSPEDMVKEQEEWYSLIEAGSHFDEIYRHQIFEAGDGSGRLAYFNLGYQTAKPGQGQALTGQFKKFASPVMDKLLEAGEVTSYGLATPAVHGGEGGSHVFWYGMSTLAARDVVSAGFEAAGKERGEEKQKEVMAGFMETIDFGAHHDRIMMVVHTGGGGGDYGEGGEGGE